MLVVLAWAFGELKAAGMAVDTVPESSLVFVEGEDAYGRVISRGVGVILKNAFVAVNYHLMAGMSEIKVYQRGNAETYKADGYLSVDEGKDLLILSVPGLVGVPVGVEGLVFPEKGKSVVLVSSPGNRKLQTAVGTVSGSKDIDGVMLPEIVSAGDIDFTNGPIFANGALVGFCVAGYPDGRFFSYAVSAWDLRRLLTRSFIIKSFNSLKDTVPIVDKGGKFQEKLMEGLTSVLWLSIEDAERQTAKKPKMIVIDVTTNWAGWGKLMQRHYSSKRIIRYLNENYYAVQLDAESSDTITFNRLLYNRNPGSPYHTLAYSLLEGQMDFPSTVFLDDKLNVIMVVPGYMDAQKLEVVLHYFGDKAYLNTRTSFQEYERKYLEKRDQ